MTDMLLIDYNEYPTGGNYGSLLLLFILPAKPSTVIVELNKCTSDNRNASHYFLLTVNGGEAR